MVDLSADLQGARERMEQAIAIEEAARPAGHPLLAVRYSNLGTVLRDLGDRDGAGLLFARAHAIARKALPADHRYVTVTASHLRSVGGDPDAA